MQTATSAALGFALFLGACGHAQHATSSSDQGTVTGRGPTSTAAPLDSPSQTSANVGDSPKGRQGAAVLSPNLLADNGGAPTEAQPTLSDDQIIGVVHTANVGEIEQGKLAQASARDSRVKRLAAMMVKDHTDADSKGMMVAKKANLKVVTSPTSESLETDAQDATKKLKTEAKADFDKDYVDTQVKEHQALLDTLDQRLVADAKSAELKAYLADFRKTVAMHLKDAETLQKEMQR